MDSSLKMRGNRCSSGSPRFNSLSPPEAPGATMIGEKECKLYSVSAPNRLLSLVFLLVCMFLLQSNKRCLILAANLLHQDGEKGRLGASRIGPISSTAGPAFSRMHHFFFTEPSAALHGSFTPCNDLGQLPASGGLCQGISDQIKSRDVGVQSPGSSLSNGVSRAGQGQD